MGLSVRSPPKKLDGADVLVWAPLEDSVVATGFCTHTVAGETIQPPTALAICVHFDQTRTYYLLHCDQDWRVLADTSHDTLELAQLQAEAEYTGVTILWRARA